MQRSETSSAEGVRSSLVGLALYIRGDQLQAPPLVQRHAELLDELPRLAAERTPALLAPPAGVVASGGDEEPATVVQATEHDPVIAVVLALLGRDHLGDVVARERRAGPLVRGPVDPLGRGVLALEDLFPVV